MKLFNHFFPLFLSLATLTTATAEFDKEFDGQTGTFVLLNSKSGKISTHNPDRAKEQFTPCSTFKIPNTLIAFETKVLADPEQKLAWDKEKYPEKTLFMKEWAKPMDIREAFKLSCVWFYKEIAAKVGEEKMNAYLKEFDYGNKDTSGGLTQFWLRSSLKISALEQVEFLRKMHERKFKLSPKTYDMAEDQVFILTKTPDYILRAKTGTGPLAKDHIIAWYVGYVTRDDNTWYFALNMDAKDMKTDYRKKIAHSILKNQGIID